MTIVDGPVGRHAIGVSGDHDDHAGRVGAEVVFDGIVRAVEGDATIEALEYEAHRPMAEQELERLAQRMVDSHGLESVEVWHSVGRVPVGAVSFRLVIRSARRKAALTAMDEFIDAFKRDVPIWKRVADRAVTDKPIGDAQAGRVR